MVYQVIHMQKKFDLEKLDEEARQDQLREIETIENNRRKNHSFVQIEKRT